VVVSDGAFVAWASAEDGTLVAVDASTGEVVLESMTEIAFGRPALALSDGVLHRIAKGTMLAAKLGETTIDETPLAAVVSERTALAAAPGGVVATELVLGVRRRARFFGARRVELDVAPLGLGERVLDETIAAGPRTTAVLTAVRANGADRVDIAVFDETGRRLGESSRPVDARAAGAAIANALVSGASVLVAGHAGLVREDLVAGRETRFSPSTVDGTARGEGDAPSATDAIVAPESILVATDAGLLVAAGHVLSRLRIRS
jgi:hypothetical protein